MGVVTPASRILRRLPRPVLAVALVLGTGAGCGAEGDTTAAPLATDAPTTFAVVGDSITAGDAPIDGTQVIGPGSWVPAAEAPGLVFAGGWAVPGTTTEDMRAGVGPVDADVLVVMGGSNDLLVPLDWATSERNLREIVATAGVAEVVLSAIPPRDEYAQAAVEYNARLRELAAREGWEYVDPWVPFAQEGTFRSGASLDGVHPTQRVADEVGVAIQAAVLDGVDG
jgi:hypothetical protein